MSEEIFEIDTCVIGAGAVGLAVAQALARDGREVIVLEAADTFGTETSSRNSEVIHAGLYYRTGSLKARLCVAGRRALYAHLDQFGITYKPCGKLVVATNDAEATSLVSLLDRALENDVEGMSEISADQAMAMEPALSPGITGALLSEATGIFDSHNYMLSLVGLLEDFGGQVAWKTPVIRGEVGPDAIDLVTGEDGETRIRARWVVNAAGHHAVRLASTITGAHQTNLPVNRYVKGSYFTISGRTPFSRLIYPMPTEASLGLHLTIDLQGQGKVGPDAEWLPETAKPPFDYQVDPARADLFYDSVRRYWPGLPDHALTPGYAGVRPKIVGPGEPSGDFRIDGPSHHGSPGLVNLLGIESPGLTSSLAIADHVCELIRRET